MFFLNASRNKKRNFCHFTNLCSEPSRLLPLIEVSGMSIAQSIDAPMTSRDTVTMSGSLSSHNGTGSGEWGVASLVFKCTHIIINDIYLGGFIMSGRRLINKGWLALEIGAGNGPVVGLKGSRTLTQRIFCTGGATVNFRRDAIIPGLFSSKLGYFFNNNKINCSS